MEYLYKAKTQLGQVIDGTIEAPDENAAIAILHGKNYVILSFDAARKDLFAADLNQIFSRINNRDIAVFTRQLSTLIDANMPLAESLRTLAQQIEKPKFQKILTNVADLVEGGASLSTALAAQPELFTSFYIKLVKSGETTGKLQDTLNYLAQYLERVDSINSKLKSALSYPAFVVFAMVVVGIIMAVYVLPQLLSIFEESGVTDLPITTRILIWTTNFINRYIVVLGFALVSGSAALWHFLKTERGQAWADDFKIKMPRMGILIRNLYLARLAESLSTMIKAQIPILEALRITSDVVGNRNYQKILLEAEDRVRAGGSMSEAFSRYEEMPPLFSSMISIGERTGKVDFMLEHISKYYKSESENQIETITQLLEPVLILILGAGVAILVSSILLPIYSLVNAG